MLQKCNCREAFAAHPPADTEGWVKNQPVNFVLMALSNGEPPPPPPLTLCQHLIALTLGRCYLISRLNLSSFNLQRGDVVVPLSQR